MPIKEFSPQIGDVGEAEWIVGTEHLADALGNKDVRVLATPMLLDIMELASANALAKSLPDDWISLGVHAELHHFRATPEGLHVWARAIIIAIDRQKVQFAIEVRDDVELIGKATHTRFCLPRSEFSRMLESKRETVSHEQSP